MNGEPSTVVLRDYQTRLLTKAIAPPAVRTCIYLPTGGGKTEIGIKLVESLLQQGPVVWAVNRIELVNQTSDRFLAAGLDHGVIQARHERTASWKDFQIASIQTLARRKISPLCSAIVIDEAHGAIAPSYRTYLAANPNIPTWGLTATPFSRGLGKVFDRLVTDVTVADLTRDGWLVPARFYAPDRPDLSDVATVAGDYHEGQLEKAVNKTVLVGNICDEWLKRANNGRTIVFATSIKHSEHIRDQFLFRGIACEHIDCYTGAEDRAAILGRLRSGATRVVTNCAVLAEGFDLPDLACMVLARPTQSLIRYLQMVGRVLRPAPGKEAALVLDHSNTVESLGFPTDDLPLTLDMGLPRKTPVTKPAKLHVCPQCKAVSRRKPDPCVACGYKPATVPFDIKQREGDLRQIKRVVAPLEMRQSFYSGLVGICEKKNYHRGWVAHKYKARFGTWPPSDLRWRAGPPNQQLEFALEAQRLRFMQARDREKRYA
jgi:superfamily II DNA or RNA helicase